MHLTLSVCEFVSYVNSVIVSHYTHTYSVARKKRPKCFRDIFYKSRAIWWNLVHSFLNKLAAKSCKRFPPQLNNVSTLPCDLWNLKCSSRRCYNCIVRERNSRIYPISTVASKFARFKSSWLQHVWSIARKKVYKIHITDLDGLKQRLRMEWAKLDHVIIAAAIRQWRRW